MNHFGGWGLGRVLAMVGLVLVVVFLVLGRLELIPAGLLWLLAFLAILT